MSPVGGQGGRAGEPRRSAAADAALALLRPLEFAARDDFARIDRISELGRSVQRACQRLLALRIPPDLSSYLEKLIDEFSKELEGESLARQIRQTLEDLAPLRDPRWPEAMLRRPLTALPGIGPKRAEHLASRGLRSVSDVLFHLPTRYEDRRSLIRVAELEVGRRATFLAEVLVVDFVTTRSGGRHRRMLQAVVGDGTGSVNLKWFRGGDAIASNIRKGGWLLITGDVKRYRFSKELVHPEIDPVDVEGAGSTEALTSEGAGGASQAGETPAANAVDQSALRRVVPSYSVPEGLNPRTLRRLIGQGVAQYADLVTGHLPDRLVEERGLPSAAEALVALHAPAPDADVEAYGAFASAAHERLVLEELYLLELGLALRRQGDRRQPGLALVPDEARAAAAESALPFALTVAQARVLREIRADLARPEPMHRLLQGDVGSGKTAVALLAAASVAHAGHQTALMAPTALLAEQHARTIAALSGEVTSPLHLRMALLTASVKKDRAGAIREALARGELDLVVGTHALVQEDVAFARLGLAVIDEQHRFGVRQRKALAERGPEGRLPHSLVMTATPIPRTLALTLYGDLDVSVIDELPPGRKPVETLLLREGEGRRITALVRAALERGEQVYVVYPLVEESEKVDLRSALESAQKIAAAFSDVRVDVVHGRLDAAERADTMARFVRGESRILVSTTVIEVGVDVPNATLMIIEHAERFGLAQLHQLRGRVGRGEKPGQCILVARGGSEKGEARLRAMLETHDGFEIAEADLRIRGPGEFLGTRQSGHMPDLRIADLLRDAKLVEVARQAALATVETDPGLTGQRELRGAVAERWGERLSLADVG